MGSSSLIKFFKFASLVSLGPFLLQPAYANGSFARRAMSVHESRTEIPSQYAREAPPHPDTLVNFRIGLASIDREGLEHALYDVSVPGSPSYGKHLSMEEVSFHISPELSRI